MIRLWKYLAAGAILIGLSAGWYITSLKLDSANLERYTALATANALKTELENERAEVIRVNSLLESLENKEAEIVYVDKIVTKEVIKYRDRIVNRCHLVSDWVCIANSAASGVPADCGAVQVQSGNP